MIRRFDDPRPAFVLDTEKSTYVFRILPTGQPEHLYYGPRIPIAGMQDLAALEEKHVFPPGNTILYDQEHPEYTLEDCCLEFSSLGKGDQREPFVEIRFPDGSRSSDFRFSDAEITDTPPDLEGLPSAYREDGKAEHLAVWFTEAGGSLVLELH